MRKKAFTLLELIFVIVVIGIMVGVGSSAFKPTYLIDDTNFILLKIKEAQHEAIGFDRRTFGGGLIAGHEDSGCITFTKNALNENATTANENYKLRVDLSSDLSGSTICFDAKGAPRVGTFNGTVLDARKTLTLTYSGESKNIVIEPRTGYVLLKKE